MFFCILCHRLAPFNRDICTRCEENLPWNLHACRRCAEPIAPGQTECARCHTDETSVTFCYAPLKYQFPINQLILQGKTTRPELLLALSRLLARRVTPATERLPDCLIPIPLHPAKQQLRGFNQAGVVAQQISKRLKIPVRYDLVEKIREPVQSQKALSRLERTDNLKRVFRVNRAKVRESGVQHAAIIDDVITTGSTINQIAAQLKSAGLQRVDAWALARTPKNSDPFPT